MLRFKKIQISPFSSAPLFRMDSFICNFRVQLSHVSVVMFTVLEERKKKENYKLHWTNATRPIPL